MLHPRSISLTRRRAACRHSRTYELRIAGDKDAIIHAIERAALTLNPDVPVVNLRTEDEVVNEVLYLERTFAMLSSVFGGLALVLACVGLYGTIAYTVAQRTNEIGIRMALGAERARILKMVLRETVAVASTGLLAGVPLVWAWRAPADGTGLWTVSA